MRLRSLQIKGFKSFANDTVLNFEENVIGVVGPNGAGKSNIVDAIRWVLGEQKSKELRLDKMSDILFNGTKTRKKVGVAQVSLTFDNTKNILPTEFETVTISRLLYRSGESEYRLNNVPCRLKDVRSLFIDTGIGSNSYAIIALGMVDDILADKDNARRRMFEQASGISKYKTRKRETLNKLKSTTEDLDRIEDLLFEIEGNLKSLEKQAKRTKKYFELKDIYREISIQYALRSISTYKDHYKVLQDKIIQEETEYRNIDIKHKNAEAELEKIKSSNIDQEQELSDKQKVLNDLVNVIRSEENDKSLSNQRLEFKNEELIKLNNAIEKSNSRQVEIDNEINIVAEKLSLENESLATLSNRTGVARQEYEGKKGEYNSIRSELDSYAKKQQSLNQKIYELEKEIAIAQNNVDNLTKEKQDTEVRQKEAQEELKETEKDFTTNSKEVALIEQEVEKNRAFLDKRNEALATLQANLASISEQQALLYRKKDSAANEYDLLKSMVDSYEGFPASIKYLSTNWNKNVPLLSDLLDVEEKYKGIIEQYLDPYLNFFLVQNMAEANQAVNLLTETQQGKASFFLLDKFNNIESQYPITPSGCIAAKDIVNVDSKYRAIIHFLLDGVYIYSGELADLDSELYRDGKAYLSATGQFIKKEKELVGGSVGLFEGKKIGRKKNLEKLEKSMVSFDTEIQKLVFKKEKIESEIILSKESDLEDRLNSVITDLNVAKEKLLRSQLKKDNSEILAISVTKRLEEIDLQLGNFTSKIQSSNIELDQSRKELEMLSGGRLFSDEEIDELGHNLNKFQEEYNSLNIELIRLQNLVDNISRELELKRSRKNDLVLEKENNIRTVEENKKVISKLTDEINRLEASLSVRYEERDEFKKNLNEAEKNYYSARNIINEKDDEARKLNRILNQAQIQINQLKEEFHEVKFKISGVGERLKIEFDIILNEIINDDVDETLPFVELELKVEKLKKRLANFGEINPMAVTAYDEMKERYDTIFVQREDILEAKKSLLETIDEIETTATAKYMEAFTKVREHFITVFRSLFTEDDTCDLILSDEENPLDSGIEIIAKPKGKKPKSLNQLSGGEKTLTATALLFALYLLKPAPFCIFDEVDAPLDDANIQKFNNIIKEFSHQSQFIVVTHNKSTMAAVDVLYGVYMQEQGVSAVTPVDFRNYDHSPIIEKVEN